MDVVGATQINRFASELANTVPTEDQESIFVLDLLESPKDLCQVVLDQAEEIRVLNAKLEALTKDLDCLTENQLIQLRLINDLRESREPKPKQRDRADILRALIAANGGKMLAKEARKKMDISSALFSQLLTTMKDNIEVKPYHLNKSWKVLVLR